VGVVAVIKACVFGFVATNMDLLQPLVPGTQTALFRNSLRPSGKIAE